jgi:beta-phosphoglucomutase family hydrolase
MPDTDLGLPEQTRACLFDLDGVVTRTAVVHAAAWKEMFDEFLRRRSAATGEPFVPFDAGHDYDAYVDGLPRAAGARGFLSSRGIELPDGSPDDPPDADTIAGLSRRKDEIVQRRIQQDGVEVYPGSLRYLEAVRAAGLRTAVVSSSRNTEAVLTVTGTAQLFDLRVDGVVAGHDHLAGKPAPDTFLAAARRLGVPADRAVVFEDALSGVQAGRAGGFARVIGVDRVGQADQLLEHGADVVVKDLADLLDHGADLLDHG